MTRPLVLALVLLASPATAADRPVAPPPKPAAVTLAGVRLAPPDVKFWLTNGPVAPEAGRLRFTHGGRRLTAGFDDDRVPDRLVSWDLGRPDRPPVLYPEQEGRGGGALSPDGRLRVGLSTSPDGRRQLWGFLDPGTGRPVHRLDPPEHEWSVPAGEWGVFSGDGRRFFTYRTVDPDRGPDGPNRVTAWDVRTGRRVAQVPGGRFAHMTLDAVSHDGSALLLRLTSPWLGDRYERVGVWDVDAGRCRWARFPLPDDAERAGEWSDTAFNADGTRLVTVYHTFSVPPLDAQLRRRFGGRVPEITFRVTDARTGRLLREVEGPPLPGWVHLPNVPPNGCGSLPSVDMYRPDPVRAVAPDGRLAAVTGEDGTVYFWDLDADRSVLRFRADGPIRAMAFSPDGRTLATCGPQGEAWLYPVPDR